MVYHTGSTGSVYAITGRASISPILLRSAVLAMERAESAAALPPAVAQAAAALSAVEVAVQAAAAVPAAQVAVPTIHCRRRHYQPC